MLLWQARFGIPMGRLTTHAAVDRSHSRYDPRSFRWDRFDAAYAKAPASCGFGVRTPMASPAGEWGLSAPGGHRYGQRLRCCAARPTR